MVKQTKTFKKGNVTKKALSAILAASMVMTSSSFVMAAPVEVEDVAVEAAAVAEDAAVVDVVEDVEAGEESVGVSKTTYEFAENTFTIGGPYDYAKNGVAGLLDAIKNAEIKCKKTVEGGTSTTEEKTLGDLKDDVNVVVETPSGDKITLDLNGTENGKAPHGVGTYKVIVTGKNTWTSGSDQTIVKGTAEATYTVNEVADPANDFLDFEVKVDGKVDGTVIYTGQPCQPKIELAIAETYDGSTHTYRTLTANDYEVVEYKDNIAVGNAKAVIQFKGLYAARGTQELSFEIEAGIPAEAKVEAAIKNPQMTYNGKDQIAEIEVKYTANASAQPVVLQYGKDYTITSVSGTVTIDSTSGEVKAKTAGDYKVKVTLVDTKYGSWNKELEFKIAKQNFNESTVEVTLPEVYFGGINISEDNIVVKDATTKEKLVKDDDYTVAFSQTDGSWGASAPSNNLEDNKNKTFSVKITATENNYKTGSIIKTYKIEDLNADSLANYIKKNGVTLNGATNGNEYEYNVNGVVPTRVTIGDQSLTPLAPNGSKIKATFPEAKDCKALGEYTIKLEGLDVYAGQTAEVTYKVVAKDVTGFNTGTVNHADNKVIISNGTGTVAPTLHKMANGKEVYSVMEIKDKEQLDGSKDVILVKGTDYDYVITEGSTADEASLVINFKGNYKGTVTFANQSVTPNAKIQLNSDIVTAVVTKSYVYDSAKKQPKAEDISVTAHIDGKDVILTPGYDYEVDPDYDSDGYKDDIAVGEATVGIRAITGTNKCEGKRIVKYQIAATEAEKENYVVDTSALKSVYEKGTAFTPSITVKTKAGRVLTTGEYDVKYYRDGKEVTSDKAAGVDAKAGTVTMKVTVKATKTDVLETSYRIATSLDKVAVIPATFADEKYTGSAIEPAVDLKTATQIPLVKGTDYTVTYSDNVKTGTAVVTIQGIGDYYGTYVRTFKITGEMDQKIEVLAAQERDLGNGSRTLNSKATKIKYTTAPETAVTYTSSDENVVTVDAEGNLKYTGLGEATITIEAKAENGYKAAKKEIKVVVKLAKPSFTPFSKNNAFTLTSSTVKGAEKFEVQYATKKNFSNAKTKTFTTTTAGKIRQVKVAAADKRTYYVRVRAVSGTTKSAWSGVKTVATK